MRLLSALCLLASALLVTACVYAVSPPGRSPRILDVAELNTDQIRALDLAHTVVSLAHDQQVERKQLDWLARQR